MAGKWNGEPDKKTWESHGFLCHIRRMKNLGHLNGYVGLPQSHPLYGKDYLEPLEILLKDQLEKRKEQPIGESPSFAVLMACCTGELRPTMESVFEVHGGITFAGKMQISDTDNDLWWVGFDTAHCGDFEPFATHHAGDEVYRDMEYVTNETEHLASQLATISEKKVESNDSQD